MRENRTHGSEGGEAKAFPTPIQWRLRRVASDDFRGLAQAVWRFEMRDKRQPSVSLGNIPRMNLIELNKADRLGLSPGPLRAWITFFKHWQEELTMATVTQEPVKQAMNRIRQLSADEEARRLAFVRERALHDEVSFLNEAKREGRKEAREEAAQNVTTMYLFSRREAERLWKYSFGGRNRARFYISRRLSRYVLRGARNRRALNPS